MDPYRCCLSQSGSPRCSVVLDGDNSSPRPPSVTSPSPIMLSHHQVQFFPTYGPEASSSAARRGDSGPPFRWRCFPPQHCLRLQAARPTIAERDSGGWRPEVLGGKLPGNFRGSDTRGRLSACGRRGSKFVFGSVGVPPGEAAFGEWLRWWEVGDRRSSHGSLGLINDEDNGRQAPSH